MVLSFVVPCYNAERFLQPCLDCILASGLQEGSFEVLCIDDGSTDRTVEIIKEYCDRYSCIRLIRHQKNKGLGAARNTGISQAGGDYIWFVDSDDQISVRSFGAVMESVGKEHLDVLCFNYSRIDEGGAELSRHCIYQDFPCTDGLSFVKQVFGQSIVYYLGYVWMYLYRTEYLRQQNLFFPEGELWEDTVYMPHALLSAEKVASLSSVCYQYRVNSTSICETFAKQYPARAIFDYSFKTGPSLYHMGKSVPDAELSNAFCNMAVKKYMNAVSLYLFRTTHAERMAFYKILSQSRGAKKSIYKWLNFFNRMVLTPYWGQLIADCGSFVYKTKHKVLSLLV